MFCTCTLLTATGIPNANKLIFTSWCTVYLSLPVINLVTFFELLHVVMFVSIFSVILYSMHTFGSLICKYSISMPLNAVFSIALFVSFIVTD